MKIQNAILLCLLLSSRAFASIATPVVTNNASDYGVKFTYTGTPTLLQLFVDTNNSATSGFAKNGIGAEYLLENGKLYRFTGTSQSTWGWTLVKSVTYSKTNLGANWTILKSDLGNTEVVKFVGAKNAPEEATVAVTVTNAPTVAISTPVVTNNSTDYAIQFNYSGTPTLFQLYIDSNNSASSGFSKDGIGAEYLVENGNLYQFNGTSQATWSWSAVKSVAHNATSGIASWTLLKADLGNTAQLKIIGARNAPETASAVVSITNTSGGTTGGTSDGLQSTIQPQASTSTFNNPERGFYVFYDNGIATSASSFTSQIAAGKTVADIGVYLGGFMDRPLDSAFLTKYQTMFNNARSAGVKLVLIHKYHDLESMNADPEASVILGHISQLAPIISSNADVVLTVHAGFLGGWGEWYYTQHKSVTVRKSIIMALLNGLPASMTVGIRTPGDKVKIFDMTAPNAPRVEIAAAKRVGHHNDCFVTGANDVGTGGEYTLSTPWRDFIGQENRVLSIPVGGETCWFDPKIGNSYGSCSNSKAEMARQGYSYMHDEGWYGPTVNGWKTNGCYGEMDQRLGYRFKVNQVTVPVEVARTGSFDFNMLLENVGYAGMINHRPVKLVLYNSQAEHTFDLNVLPQKWIPGVHTINQTINLSQLAIAAGDYNVAIWMPDNAVGLRSRPVYSVQFANQQAWDSVKGRNILKNAGQGNLVIRVN